MKELQQSSAALQKCLPDKSSTTNGHQVVVNGFPKKTSKSCAVKGNFVSLARITFQTSVYAYDSYC